MSRELTECSRNFQEIEAQRSALLAELAQWPPGRLSFRPTSGAWSAVEVLDHIVRAETETIADVQSTLHDPHPLGALERPGIAALDRALRSDKRFKVPAGSESIYPDATTSLAEVASRWNQVRAQTRVILETLDDADARCGVFYHPFAGWMTFAELLDHFSAHLYHHEFQLARLRVSSAHLP